MVWYVRAQVLPVPAARRQEGGSPMADDRLGFGQLASEVATLRSDWTAATTSACADCDHAGKRKDPGLPPRTIAALTLHFV